MVSASLSRSSSTIVYAALLAVLACLGTPTRVGDGGEYAAMALNLARLEPPALSRNDLVRVERRFDALGPDYREAAIRFDDLVGRDGRQDFPHFWMYPLAVAPVLAITEALGMHPNHAFTVVNVILLTVAWWFVAPRLGLPLTALVFVSPIVWWVDKAHTEAYTFACLLVAFALAGSRPAHALVALGLACAQYPPLAVTLPVVLVAVWHRHWRARHDAAPMPARPIVAATLIAIALAALPVTYYMVRIGMATPLVQWTSRQVPSIGAAARFLTDPNIGLAWAFPALMVVVVVALLGAARRAPRQLLGLPLLAGPVCGALLLAGFTQSVNINHGATPSLNRQSLWLVSLVLPWLLAWRDGRQGREGHAVRAIVALSVIGSAWAYAPVTRERYLAPTPSAAWIWQHAPGADNPPIEIFAERASHTEPGLVPTATPGCTKALVSGGWWPVPCAPASLPAGCRGPGQHCYANATRTGYQFEPVSLREGVHVVANPRKWPAAGASALVAALAEADACGAATTPAGEPGSVVRASSQMDWTFTRQCDAFILVYAASPREGAQVTLRLPRTMTATIETIPSATRTTVAVPVAEPWAAVTLDVPASRDGVLVTFR